MTMKKILTLLLMTLTFATAKAQTDDEYRMEIGAGVGLVSYEGDFNGSVLSNMQMGGSVVLRRIFNPYATTAERSASRRSSSADWVPRS